MALDGIGTVHGELLEAVKLTAVMYSSCLQFNTNNKLEVQLISLSKQALVSSNFVRDKIGLRPDGRGKDCNVGSQLQHC